MNRINYLYNIYIIAQGMQCSLDRLLSSYTTSSNCDQFSSKISYSSLAIAGDTKFSLVYVGFRNDFIYYPNSIAEGNIAPPSLVYHIHHDLCIFLDDIHVY